MTTKWDVSVITYYRIGAVVIETTQFKTLVNDKSINQFQFQQTNIWLFLGKRMINN